MDHQTYGTAVTAPATLLEQVRLLAPPVEQPPEMTATADALERFDAKDDLLRQAEAEQETLPDGYQRRSPVQPYRVPPEYRRRQRMLALAVILLVVFVAVGIFLYLRLR